MYIDEHMLVYKIKNDFVQKLCACNKKWKTKEHFFYYTFDRKTIECKIKFNFKLKYDKISTSRWILFCTWNVLKTIYFFVFQFRNIEINFSITVQDFIFNF